MSDIEKNPANVTTPPVETDPPKTGKLINLVKGTTVNDPNVLGRELLQKALEFDEAQLERDSIKVRRKLDWMVIPMVRTKRA